MGNLTTSLVFVLALNLFLFLAQASMMDLNPNNANVIYSSTDGIIEKNNINTNGGDPILETDKNTINSQLPSGDNNIVTNLVNIITDTFNSIKSWFSNTLGLKYIYNILSAPYSMLAIAGLPEVFRFAIGSFWYAYSLFVIVAFFWGRE